MGKGIFIVQSGQPIAIKGAWYDASNNEVTTGAPTVEIYEEQADGSYKTFDFADNTVKSATTTVTTLTAAMTHQTGNNGAVNLGVFSYVQSTVSGFTRGRRYMARMYHASGVPARQKWEFQYGEGEGDLEVDAAGNAAANAKKWNEDPITGTYADDVQGASTKAGLALSATENATTYIGFINDRLPADPAAVGSAMTLTSGERTSVAGAVWAALTSGMTAVGSIGKKLADWALGTDNRVLVSANAHTSGQTVANVTDKSGVTLAAGAITSGTLDASAVTAIQSGLSTLTASQVKTQVDQGLLDVGLTTAVTGRIDVAVGSRMATFTYTAPDNAGIANVLTQATTAATQATQANTKAGAIQVVSDKLATMIDGSNQFTAPALALAPAGGAGLTTQQVRDAMKLAPTAGAAATGSVDAKLDSAGGGATVEEIAAALAGQVPVIANAAVVGGLVQIIRKDSYKNSEGSGRSLPFTKQATETTWPDTINEAHYYCKPTTETLDRYPSAVGLASGVEMTVVTATGSGQQVRLDLTPEQTGALQAGLTSTGGYTYWIIANRSTEPATLRSGTMTVRPDPTA